MKMLLDSLVAAGWARVTPALALALAVSVTGCDSLIDVENPNNVKEEDLEDPSAAASLVSGSLFEVSDAWGTALTPYATITDELEWIGSRDSWKQLDEGDVSDRTNEFTDAAFPDVGEARWLADETIRRLEAFDAAGDLANPSLLAQAYLYGALAYIQIADRWDDFVVTSSKEEAGPNVGEANMGGLYDVAIGYLTSALGIATAADDFRAGLLALRASTEHRKAIWGLVQPSVSGATPKYVGVPASAVNDANAALAIVGGDDFVLQFNYDFSTLGNNIGAWTNERLEHVIDSRYVVKSANGKTVAGCGEAAGCQIALLDPITGNPDPELFEIVTEFTARQFGPLRITSEQELYLILAENAFVASGLDPDDATAAGYINDLRDLNGLDDFDPADAAHPTVGEMIQHHRTASLFLQGRRLSDMYRFGINTGPGVRWTTGSEALTAPGVFMPITLIECNANPQAC